MRLDEHAAGIGTWLRAGAVAGLAGGLVFGAAMIELGVLPTVASIVRADSAVVGFVVHMAIAAVVGAGFGVLVRRQRLGAGEMLFWGLTYGTLWWFLGALTLLPLLLGEGLAWDVPSAQAALPSFFGHLLYGATAALVLVWLGRERVTRPSLGALLRGATAGLCAAWVVGLLLDAQDRLALFTDADITSGAGLWAATLGAGVVAGAGYALLYPIPAATAGPRLVRGTVFGFLWWVAVTRTLLPVLDGDGLPWSVEAARSDFAALIGSMLFGAALAVIYGWLDGLGRLLFAEESDDPEEEGAGTQGLRAIGRGAAAGIVGGLLFTLVMVQVGFLPTVASLIGAGSEAAGFLVHLVISFLIGAAYGLLFRRQSLDTGSALGWGVSYGFVWWLLGPLTLLPLLLGEPPEWTAAVAASLFASLIGHLTYGAGLGLTFYWLESRYSPWWIPRTRMDEMRIERRREQLRTSAPALWALVVVIALTLPVVLGMPGAGAAGVR
ncbi:MAG: hypothetical protein ACRDJE_00075 [Dehalococcoidia bacterium]